MQIKRMGLILSFLFATVVAWSAESGWVIITGEYCNLRAKADSSSTLVEKLPQYSPIKLLGEQEGEYFKAQTRDGETGWAHESVVGTSGYASAKPGKVNWRVAPSIDAEKKYEVEQPDYNPLRVLERKGDYVHIQDFEKDKGWMHVSLLTTKPYCVVTKDVAEVRIGPGEEQPVRFRAVKRVVLEVLSKKDGWLEVRHKDGNSGWIKAEDVWGTRKIPDSEMPAASKPATAKAASEPAA